MTLTYKDRPLSYKIGKVLRYVRLYGPSRTLAKVRGQYHMADSGQPPACGVWINARCSDRDHSRRNVAIIGCGNFAFTTIAYYRASRNPHFLRSAFDADKRRAVSLCETYRGAKVVDTVDEIVADPSVDLVFIASNQQSHAVYARQLIAAGKHVHIKKPHVVSWSQLSDLSDAIVANPGSRVYLGFNRPRSGLFRFVEKHLSAQWGTTMINWFIAGHQVPDDHWYFSEDEGGRILGNLCHWTDLTLRLVGLGKAFPAEVISGSDPESRSDFALSYRFSDGSDTVLSFSAKGHYGTTCPPWSGRSSTSFIGMFSAVDSWTGRPASSTTSCKDCGSRC